MENIQICTLQDFSGNTKTFVQVWNENLGETFPISEQLFDRNLLKNDWVDQQNSYVALAEDKVIGFLFSKKGQEGQVWLSALLVDGQFRKKGIGRTLLQRFENEVSTGKKITVGADLYHLFPGVPTEQVDTIKFLEKCGYQKTEETFDLIADLSLLTEKYPIDPIYSVRRLQDGEEDQLIVFFEKEFPGRWTYEIKEALAKQDRKVDGTIGLFKGEEIIGFTNVNTFQDGYVAPNVYWKDLLHQHYGGLGPIGVAEAYRGLGLGAVLLEKAVLQLQKEGVKELVIDWTVYLNYYEKVGSKVWKRYTQMNKTKK